MSYRAGIILLQADKVALIERHRSGLHYFTFPGGHIDTGESPRKAAIREAEEELGLQVKLRRLIAKFKWEGDWQYYYLAEIVGGSFGTGNGEELFTAPASRGTYYPLWLPLVELIKQPVKPHQLAEIVFRSSKEGWPPKPVILSE
jgi:8-oxo-dGTP diphosphatase